MSKLVTKTLERIKKEHIKPLPHWKILLRRSVLWTLIIMSILIGGFVFSFVLLHLTETDWDLAPRLGHGIPKFVLFSLPYFWLLSMSAILILIYFEFRKTNHGYRYPLILIGSGIISISLLLGTIIHFSGINSSLEDHFRKFSPYEKIMLVREQLWMNPEQGVLTGMIKEISLPTSFVLIDLNRQIWIVDVQLIEKDLSFLEEKIEVKILGEKTAEQQFQAEEIRPWRKPCPPGRPFCQHQKDKKMPERKK